MGLIDGIFKGTDTDVIQGGNGDYEDQFYELEDNVKKIDNKKESVKEKMVLLEPRAFSESTQIVDYLKKRNTIVINLKRVTSEQAKRIIDYVSGATYALKGNIEKIGSGIFLCTPNNINIQGKISNDKDDKELYDNDDIEIDW